MHSLPRDSSGLTYPSTCGLMLQLAEYRLICLFFIRYTFPFSHHKLCARISHDCRFCERYDFSSYLVCSCKRSLHFCFCSYCNFSDFLLAVCQCRGRPLCLIFHSFRRTCSLFLLSNSITMLALVASYSIILFQLYIRKSYGLTIYPGIGSTDPNAYWTTEVTLGTQKLNLTVDTGSADL